MRMTTYGPTINGRDLDGQCLAGFGWVCNGFNAVWERVRRIQNQNLTILVLAYARARGARCRERSGQIWVCGGVLDRRATEGLCQRGRLADSDDASGQAAMGAAGDNFRHPY